MKKRLINYYTGEIYHIFNAVIHSTNRAHLEWLGLKRLWPVHFLVDDGHQEANGRGESTFVGPSPWSLELELERCLPAESGCQSQAHDGSI